MWEEIRSSRPPSAASRLRIADATGALPKTERVKYEIAYAKED